MIGDRKLPYSAGANDVDAFVREVGKLPTAAGMWWLTLPLLGWALWLYFRDGRLGRRTRAGA